MKPAVVAEKRSQERVDTRLDATAAVHFAKDPAGASPPVAATVLDYSPNGVRVLVRVSESKRMFERLQKETAVVVVKVASDAALPLTLVGAVRWSRLSAHAEGVEVG